MYKERYGFINREEKTAKINGKHIINNNLFNFDQTQILINIYFKIFFFFNLIV